jgi:hypothetical protein
VITNTCDVGIPGTDGAPAYNPSWHIFGVLSAGNTVNTYMFGFDAYHRLVALSL